MQKWVIKIQLILIASLFIGCDAKHNMGDNQSSLANSQELAKLFEQTLHPVLVQNCNQCHGVNQTPMFAQNDSFLSYEALNSRQLVSLTDPANSRIVAKIQNGHQSFAISLAVTLTLKIEEWAALAEEMGVDNRPNPTLPNPPALTGILSVDEFGKTLYPLIQTNCANCHGVDQQPMFAITDVTDSHDYLIDTALVDLQNPSNSRVVTQVLSGHQNFAPALGEELETQIIAWADNIVAEGGMLPEPPPLEATFTSIHNRILIPKCVGCHSPGGERSKEDYSDYQTTLQTGKVKPGDSNDSDMYKECADGEMPEDAPNLSNEELTVLRDWINAGALDN